MDARRVGLLLVMCVVGVSASAAQGATILVDNADDAGGGSLRAAIKKANLDGAPDKIRFTVDGTVELESALPELSTEMVIKAYRREVTVERTGTPEFRIFTVPASGNASIYRITIAGGLITGTGNPSEGGGGILNEGTLKLRDVTVAGNEMTDGGDAGANLWGAGLLNTGGTLKVGKSTFTANSFTDGTCDFADCANGAGTVAIRGGSATITNSTIAANNPGGTSTTFTSGIAYLTNGTLATRAVTLAGNIGQYQNSLPAYPNNWTAKNTIIASLGASTGGRTCQGPPMSNGYNLTDDDIDMGSDFIVSCGMNQTGDLTDTDPLLDPLADNGGPTETMALQATSPAIDQGGGQTLPEDQRHGLRPFDFLAITDADNGSDIGAFERTDAD